MGTLEKPLGNNKARTGKHHNVITAGTSPSIWTDLGKDEPGMTVRRREREGQRYFWHDCMVDGKVVKSFVNTDKVCRFNRNSV